MESTSEAFQALHVAFKEMLDKTLWGASGDERLKLKQLDKENRIRSRVTIEHPKLDIPVQLPFLPSENRNQQERFLLAGGVTYDCVSGCPSTGWQKA